LTLKHLIVKTIEGEVSYSRRELPLRVGTGNDCQVRLPGPGGNAVAMLDLLDGILIIQPILKEAHLLLNDRELDATRRLSNGDIVKFFGSSIRVNIDEKGIILEIQLEDSAYVTQPPKFDDASTNQEYKKITPITFRPSVPDSEDLLFFKENKIKLFVGISLIFLLSTSFLLFTSKSINFEISPSEPNEFNIEGGWFRFPIGDRILLRKGNYKVNVKKDGYYDVSQTFYVGEDSSMTVPIKMRKKPGKIIVSVEPNIEATVTVNDLLIGSAPFGPIELEPGPHIIKVESDRYLPFINTVNIAGLNQTEYLSILLTPKWADVKIQSDPSGATIIANGDEMGITPAAIELLEGPHELSIIKSGFSAWDGDISVLSDVPQILPKVKLLPADANLLVETIPKGANITVNERYRGQSPLTLSLSPDIDYKIGISKAGYGLTSRNLRLQAASNQSITVDLSAREGTVTLDVFPKDATIFVDGSARGTGKKVLRLSSSPHKIIVKRKGYRDWSTVITPRPGYPQSLKVRLRSLEEIAKNSVIRKVKTAGDQTLQLIDGGTFLMGASRSENGRRANEVIRPVRITSSYFISVNEITNKEFSEFRKNHDSGADVHISLAADQNPVSNVTWSDAVQYCNWLSQQEGLTQVYKKEFGEWVPIYPFPDGYRLPTEAEWVWAIRFAELSSPTKFPWGKSWPPQKKSGNFADEASRELVPSIISNFNDGYASTSPVASFQPNRIGIYDGGGNVAEWVNDWYTVPTPGISEPILNPMGPLKGKSKVIRGSSWKHAGFTELRLSYRDYGVDARVDLGFRIARNAN
tara:strand:- start:171 stop:2597 length:2427 start_codon:yes stop_codon:yes gene_type:complete